MPVRPQQLGDRGLGARACPAATPARVRGAWARITRSPIQARASRSTMIGSSRRRCSRASVDDAVELPPEPDLLAERRDAALEPEGRHRHPPAVAGLADHERRIGARVVEEHLVELRGPGDLLDRPDLDARLVHRHQQVGQPVVPGGPGFGAGDDEAPVGQMCQRGPDFLPGDRPLVAVEAARWWTRRPGPIRRRARSSPGTTARPRALICGRNRACCSGVPYAISVGPSRSSPRWLTRRGASARAYSSWKIDLLGDGGAAPAVLDRPADAGPAGGGQVAVPVPALGVHLVLAARAAAAASSANRPVRFSASQSGSRHGSRAASSRPARRRRRRTVRRRLRACLAGSHPRKLPYQALAL